MLSPEDYNSLDGPERMRRKAALELIEILKITRREAAEKGLTEEELERLLADGS